MEGARRSWAGSRAVGIQGHALRSPDEILKVQARGMSSRKWNRDGTGQQDVPHRRCARRMPAPPLPTLEDLPSLGVKALRLQCGNYHRCWHRGLLPVDAVDLRQTIVD